MKLLISTLRTPFHHLDRRKSLPCLAALIRIIDCTRLWAMNIAIWLSLAHSSPSACLVRLLMLEVTTNVGIAGGQRWVCTCKAIWSSVVSRCCINDVMIVWRRPSRRTLCRRRRRHRCTVAILNSATPGILKMSILRCGDSRGDIRGSRKRRITSFTSLLARTWRRFVCSC